MVIDVDLRPGPSANVVLVDDVLVDTGGDSPASHARLREFIDGRRVSSAERWPQVAYRVIGKP